MTPVTAYALRRRERAAGESEEDIVRDSGPIANRIMLGAQLRRLREGQGISRSVAGYEIRASESKISRMELGRVGFKERDVADLLTLYGVEDHVRRAPILDLAREANRPGWWQSFGDVLPHWAEPHIGLESAATLIRTYQIQLVPALLQTEDYARAVIQASANPGVDRPEIIERRVRLRMMRQRILDRTEPATLWAVVDEAALWRRIGSPAVMRAQLQHLLTLVERSNIVIQVLPIAYGAHFATGGAFSILRFAEPDLPDVVHLDHLTTATDLEKPEGVDRYEELFTRLTVDSTQPDHLTAPLNRIFPHL